MNKQEFLGELEKKLGRLPDNERQDVMEYYNEYFEDAGEENEQAVLAELGSADSVAKRLNASYVVKNISTSEEQQTPKRGIKAIFTVVAAIFAAPIALPLAFAAVVVAIALAFAGAMVLFSFLLACVVGTICGAVNVVIGVATIATGIGTSLMFIGGGLMLVGLGVAAGVCVVRLSGICFNFIARMMSKILPKNSKDPNIQGGQ